MNLSICTSLYNSRAETLEAVRNTLVRSLGSVDLPPGTELVVLDDCSPLEAETQALFADEALAGRFERFTYQRNDKNLGFAGSFNRAMLEVAQGEVVVALNSDAYLTQGALIELLARLEGFDAIGPATNDRVSWTPQYVKQAPFLTDYGDAAQYAEMEGWGVWMHEQFAGQVRSTNLVAGMCFMIAQETLRSVGGFSADYGSGYLEDTDLCQKLRAAGHQLGIAKGAYVHHGGVYGSANSMRQLGLRILLTIAGNVRRYSRKWGRWHFVTLVRQGLAMQWTGRGTLSEEVDELSYPG